jgi:hypothetical protein
VRGFDALGVEVDTVAVDLARADGLSVTMPGDPLPPGAFDLVSFWETLEHIADPLGALREFVPHLADDGLVAITVPNMGSLQARIMRESCSWIHGGYNTPGHVNLFHVSALARLLERAGLTAIEYDGQFSGNPLELAAYLAAHSRGAFDALIDAAPRAAGLPSTVGSVLSAIWPGAALLERMALASPILRVVACRAGHERQFKGVIDERRSARHREIAAAAESMLAAEPDYKAMAAALQHEVNRRDDLLREQQQRFERSVEGRVRALARTLLGR